MLRKLVPGVMFAAGLALATAGALAPAEAVLHDHYCIVVGTECSTNNHGGEPGGQGDCVYQCWYCPSQPDLSCFAEDNKCCDSVVPEDPDCPTDPTPMKSDCEEGRCAVPWQPISTGCGQYYDCKTVACP